MLPKTQSDYYDRIAKQIVEEDRRVYGDIWRQLYPKPYECIERDAEILKRINERKLKR